MARDRLKPTLLCAVLVLASPAILIALILLEVALFGTRYISDTAETVGLTPFLQKVFTALGING